MRPATPPLTMTDAQREILQTMAKSRTAPHREVTRAKALLLAEQRVATSLIASQVGVSPTSVTSWPSEAARRLLQVAEDPP